MALEDVWQRQRQWSESADALKADMQKWRNRALALTLVGAVLANAGVMWGLDSTIGKSLAGISGFVVAAGALIRPRGSTKAVLDWTRSRSVSEALKTEIYLYLNQRGDYAKGDPVAQLDAALTDLEGKAAELTPPEDFPLRKQRQLPKASTPTTYVTERLDSQIKYYGDNSTKLADKIKRVKNIELGVGLLAAAVAAVAGATEVENVAIWVPVVSALAAAVAAHAAGERYEYLLVEYRRTAGQLKFLKRTAVGKPDFIEQCESVISTQNQGWMAKFGEGEEGAT